MATAETAVAAPAVWSFSAMLDARECPRRWSLRRRGHSPLAPVAGASDASPGFGSLRGRVCHAALARMIEAHRAHVGPPWGSPRLQGFWRERFPRGLTALVREEAQRALMSGATASAATRASRIGRELDEAIPSLVRIVSTLLRMAMSRAAGPEGCTVHAEVSVNGEVAPGLPWTGRIDAVIRHGASVTLIDFKTGVPSTADLEQLVAYACLFDQDEVTRTWGEVDRLVVLYARGEVEDHLAPRGEALAAARAQLAAETRRVSLRLASSPPEASPAPERCARCDVRGRCDDYWRERSSWEDPSVGASIDAEGVVSEVLADGRALRVRVGAETLLARLSPNLVDGARGLAAGARVRLVGARPTLGSDPSGEPTQERVVDVPPSGLIISGS